MWRRLADWCVPVSAMDWGQLTVTDLRPSVVFDADGNGTAYVAGEVWPIRTSLPVPTVDEIRPVLWPDLTPGLTRDSFRGFKPDEDA